MTDSIQIKHKNLTWLHYNQPLSKDSQKFLAKKYNFSQESLSNCSLKKTPRPKINIHSKYTYFVFHIPYKNPKNSNFSIAELNVFITKSALVTIESRGNIQALNNFYTQIIESSSLKETRFKHGISKLFTKLITTIMTSLHELINDQGAAIDKLHQEVFEKRVAKLFIETVSKIRYNQIVAHNSLERQIRTFDTHLTNNNPLTSIDGTTAADWNKILDSFHTAIYELESDMDHLEGLVTTFESLVTFRTNEVIKLLTLFSVIVLPLNLVSGIYGMNFSFIPLSGHPYGFYINIMWMFIIAIVVATIFKLKRWF